MKNQIIARIFDNLANLLEIKGGDAYKVRAYRRAAAEIDSLAENLDEISKRGELEEIPGIGQSIAGKIKDILETGTTLAYEELKTQFPEGLLDILSIPGIGPKTVKLLYEKMGISSVDELAKAAKEQRIRKETNLGAKAEVSILRAIETRRRGDERLSIGAVLPMAEDVIDRLQRSHGVEQISAAGSLRRRRDTIGDIDIVVETTDVQAVMEAFTHLPQVDEVIETGQSMSAVRTRFGLRMDLRVASKEHYGAMLHHFTGSKQHNIKLHGMARDKGLTINEYGIFRLDNGEKVVSGRTEQEIYQALDLPWIPPELREDRGEVEAAMEGRLPDLVGEQNIKGDLHVHSRASDGGNTIPEIIDAAKSRGYSYVAICDHSKSLTIAHGLNEERLLQQIDEIRRINQGLEGFRVLAGIEVDIRADGSLDVDPHVIEKLDIVVGSIHHRHKQDREQMTRRIVTAIETGMVDIFAHPTGRIINHRDPYDVDLDKVFDAAKAHSTAMEINSTPDRLDLHDIYVRMAKDRGLKISVNTDAHNVSEFASIRLGLFMARRGWLQASDVLNAMPLNELLTWLNTRRPRG
ncbi:MAG: DNA polymerase/3'-5' exonuclease PolX [Armatimonadota bacterium]